MCAFTFGNLPRITRNVVFPFLREWLSYVHSVFSFQCPIGTMAKTFIQVQSSYAGQKLILGMNLWMCLRPGPELQTNLPLKVSKPRSGLFYHDLITHYDCGILTFLICIHAHYLYMLLHSWLKLCFL